jgi:hypothetical protein
LGVAGLGVMAHYAHDMGSAPLDVEGVTSRRMDSLGTR